MGEWQGITFRFVLRLLELFILHLRVLGQLVKGTVLFWTLLDWGG